MPNDIQDYTPYMDRYPELKLRPVTEFPGHELIQKYDYVQDLRLTGKSAPNGVFYIIVRDGKMGLYLYSSGLIWDTTTIALKPVYESIEFMYYQGKSFGVIIKSKGKYGMIFWSYGIPFNHQEIIDAVYDTIEKQDNGRYRAVNGGQVTYFNSVGQILK